MKPDGKWKCRVCQTVWDGSQLKDDPMSTAVKWTCADYFCGGTCDRQVEEKQEEVQCQTCEGSGELAGDYFAEDGIAPCPDCGGKGFLNGTDNQCSVVSKNQ